MGAAGPKSLELVLTQVLLQDKDGSLHSMLALRQLLHMIRGLSAKGCCWQESTTNICDQWRLVQVDGKLFPFPRVVFGRCPANGTDDDEMFSVGLEGTHRDDGFPGAG